jgi:type IV secretory pathway VirB2 component (pilin)
MPALLLSPLPIVPPSFLLTAVNPNANSTGISLNPAQTGNLPGDQTLTSLASGLGHWALLAAIVGVIVGGIMWAFGHFAHNYQQSYNGRRGLIVSGVAALLIGASQEIVGFFFTQGLGLH